MSQADSKTITRSPVGETSCNCLMCLAEGENSPHRIRSAMGGAPSRRRFLATAAGASVLSIGSLAAAAMAPNVPAAVTTPRHGRPDPALVLIADKLAADIAHGEAIDVQDEADERSGFHSDESSAADERCLVACRAVNAIDWKLATTPPTTLAGVAAVLRFANEIEDGGMEWPATDVVGAEGWHYQLRATMAAAVEALINVPATELRPNIETKLEAAVLS